MRRLITALILVLVPVFAIGTALVDARSRPVPAASKHTPVSEHKPPARSCPKKGKKKKCRPAKAKATPTSTRAARPAPTRTATATLVPTMTPTSTATPTLTPTATQTPTPEPSLASIAVRAETNENYHAGFIVCGLPEHVQARFDPNPATSKPEQTFGPISAAQTTLTVSTSWNAMPNTYGLEIFTYLQDSAGNPVSTGGFVDPQAVTLTIDDQGRPSLEPAYTVIPTNGQGCTAPPAGFAPKVEPTPSPSEIRVSASVSTPNPAANTQFILTGTITGRGKPLANVPVQFAFYGPYAMPSCSSYTDWEGHATCTRINSNALHGAPVLVQVTFRYNDQTYTAYTSYTM